MSGERFFSLSVTFTGLLWLGIVFFVFILLGFIEIFIEFSSNTEKILASISSNSFSVFVPPTPSKPPIMCTYVF